MSKNAELDQRLTQLELAITSKADVSADLNNLSTSDFRTLLRLSAERGHENICDYLIKQKKVDVNAADPVTYRTALHEAAKHGKPRIWRLLLQNLAEESLLKMDNEMNYPIHEAAKSGDLETCQAVLFRNETLSLTDADGNSPLAIAAKNGHLAACNLFLQRGADVNNRESIQNPLILAAENGKADVCRLLVESGADTTRVDRRDGGKNTAAHYSVKDADLYRVFEERLANREPNQAGKTPQQLREKYMTEQRAALRNARTPSMPNSTTAVAVVSTSQTSQRQ